MTEEERRKQIEQLESELDNLLKEKKSVMSQFGAQEGTPSTASPTREDPPVKANGVPGSPIRQAEEARLVGVSMSGGGIRSATFNLGVLQALADADLLRKIDYISAVSGGSYIASWLAGWSKRQQDGIRRVQRWLSPLRSPNPDAEEVRPIHFLRQYSNYLTPRKGFLTADTWTGVAIWMRNTLLNQMVIILLLSGVMMCPWVLRNVLAGSSAIAGRLTWISSILLVLAGFAIGLHLAWFDQGRHEGDNRSAGNYSQNSVQWVIVSALLAWAFLFTCVSYSTLLNHQDSSAAASVSLTAHILFWTLVGTLFATQVSGRLAHCFYFHEDERLPFRRWAIAFVTLTVVAFGAAVIGAALYRFVLDKLSTYTPILLQKPFLVFGPPVLLSIVLLIVTLHVGLLGVNFPDERREWWGRLGAWVFLYILGWLALFGIAIYVGPWFHQPRPVLKTIAALFWASWSASGVTLGRSGKMSALKRAEESPGTSGLDLIAKIAPYIFLVGVLTVVSFGVYSFLAVHPRSSNFLAYLHMPRRHWLVTVAAFALERHWLVTATVITFALGGVLAWRFDVNEFSMHHFYRNRLMRCYLGATVNPDERQPNPFTGFDRRDDVKLGHCRVPSQDSKKPEKPGYVGPYPLINTALNLVAGKELAWQERKAESFIFSPIYCGYEYVRTEKPRDGTRAVLDLFRKRSARFTDVGFRPTLAYAYPSGGVGVSTTMAISGAAASPNMGYHSSPALTFLMTIFNARLGWWIGNTRHDSKWRRWSPRLGLMYLLSELTGSTNDRRGYVNLSDGGHFENLGIYELVRRHCTFIIACDAEQDRSFTFGGLGNAVRKCRTDFGVNIDVKLDRVKKIKISNEHFAHWVVGDINYPEGYYGKLLYIKSSLTGEEPADVREYGWREKHFPHQTTADQFFDESQFESYRTLGRHVIHSLPNFLLHKDFGALFLDAEKACAMPPEADVRISMLRIGQVELG
jgi:hypothetical protein